MNGDLGAKPKKENANLFSNFNENLSASLDTIYSHKYKVYSHRNLIYNRIYGIEEPKTPRRGKNALEADIVIEEVLNSNVGIPLVAIELKTGAYFNTHDVITTSKKAEKHKSIYPWLRYGFIWFSNQSIRTLFFRHNESLDFAGGISEYDVENMQNRWQILVRLVQSQIQIAETFRGIITHDENFEGPIFYSSNADFIHLV